MILPHVLTTLVFLIPVSASLVTVNVLVCRCRGTIRHLSGTTTIQRTLTYRQSSARQQLRFTNGTWTIRTWPQTAEPSALPQMECKPCATGKSAAETRLARIETRSPAAPESTLSEHRGSPLVPLELPARAFD